MADRYRSKKVVRMKRKKPKLTGFFLILFSIYILFQGISSFTKNHVSIYEVTEKKIAEDNLVRGIIMRNEKLVKSDQSGYINYYVADGTKVGARTKIYSIDETGQIYNQLADSETEQITISQKNTNDIRSEIDAYRTSFDLAHFDETYNFKYNLENTVSELTNAQLLDNVTNILKKEGGDSSFRFGSAGESGIISYTSDGMEGLDMNDITAETFESTADEQKQLRQTKSVKAKTPIYRLVTNESWSVVFPLSKEQFTNIQKEKNITVTLKKIQARVNPQVTTFTMDGGYYARIDLKRYMIQYINNRYIDLEIKMNDEAGLKIPKSSVLHKDFYKIPAEYIVESQEKGQVVEKVSYKKDGSPQYDPVSTLILSFDDDTEDDTQKYCYIPADALPAGTEIASDMVGSDVIRLSEVQKIDGVYCCNKGYCEFRPVEILYQNSEYCIVSKDTNNGLSSYDHIVLDPKTIGEDDIIY
ncbi:MAG: hypothetical protein MR965_07985 [Lachnospiraceae bacterium]|nr:hypothetical protein [Lachnospiraceae bacterium]